MVSSVFDYGWEQMRKLGVDMVDEHYYKSPEWFRNCQATDSWLKQFMPKALMN